MVTLSKELDDKITAYCESVGVTKSNYIAMCLAEKVSANDRLFAMAENALKQMTEVARTNPTV